MDPNGKVLQDLAAIVKEQRKTTLAIQEMLRSQQEQLRESQELSR